MKTTVETSFSRSVCYYSVCKSQLTSLFRTCVSGCIHDRATVCVVVFAVTEGVAEPDKLLIDILVLMNLPYKVEFV